MPRVERGETRLVPEEGKHRKSQPEMFGENKLVPVSLLHAQKPNGLGAEDFFNTGEVKRFYLIWKPM